MSAFNYWPGSFDPPEPDDDPDDARDHEYAYQEDQ